MTYRDLIDIGFVAVPKSKDGVIYQFSKDRYLYAVGIGTSDEMLSVCEIEEDDKKIVTDCICVHAYEYDGSLTIEKVKKSINIFYK